MNLQNNESHLYNIYTTLNDMSVYYNERHYNIDKNNFKKHFKANPRTNSKLRKIR